MTEYPPDAAERAALGGAIYAAYVAWFKKAHGEGGKTFGTLTLIGIKAMADALAIVIRTSSDRIASGIKQDPKILTGELLDLAEVTLRQGVQKSPGR